ncbi:hypothetical protein GCM10011369_05430 [Neiella marina]|uniref:ThuA-like domain-containing protein n=1 Tax=Neiella marina TaxID=508461 RepID=A0A8J2XMR5_9GAMM|nr:ThuA domain-containing protein [Neiella marina]GGA66767.1 hypothetical protein GCM10011369_05430 [Neiella marina]
MTSTSPKTLALAGDCWHPQQLVKNAFADCYSHSIDWRNAIEQSSIDSLQEFDIILLAKANHLSDSDDKPWMTPVIEQALVDYVEQGGKLWVLHSGLAEYDHHPRLCHLMGATFVQHPEPCDVTTRTTQAHPLTNSVTAFSLLDEHYEVVITDPQIEIVLKTESSYGTYPAGWFKQQGKGKVCGLTPTHFAAGWQQAQLQQLLQNTLDWLAN